MSLTNMTYEPQEVKEFLSILGKNGNSRMRALKGKPVDGERNHKLTQKIVERAVAAGNGAYLVIGNGGDCDEDITDIPAVFCEWDDKPVEWQISAWRELGLPEPSCQVDTGNKSVHSYWVFEESMLPDHWRRIQCSLIEHCKSDKSLKNPSRVMRLPGYPHQDTGKLARLINVTGKRYTPEQLERVLPAINPRPATKSAPEPRGTDLELITDALRVIPPRVSGAGQKDPSYDDWMGILWGIATELGPDAAADLVAAHCPQWDEDLKVKAKQTRGSYSIGTLFHWAKRHGWQGADGELGDTIAANPTLFENVLRLGFAGGEGYVSVGDNLFRWAGTHYALVEPAEVRATIRKALRTLAATSDEKDKCCTPTNAANCLRWVLGCTEVPPSRLNPPGHINARNGVIRLTVDDDWSLSVELLPHTPELVFTEEPTWDFTPDADPKHCNRMLDALDDKDCEAFLEWTSTSLSLGSVRKRVGRVQTALLLGGGSNGKDVILDATRQVHGVRQTSSISLAHFYQHGKGEGAGRFALGRLVGSKLNVGSESSSNFKLDAGESLKAVTSGNSIFVEFKNRDGYEFRPETLLAFNFNELLQLDSGQSEAIGSRYILVEFRKTFVEAAAWQEGQLKADPRFANDPQWVAEHVIPAYFNRLVEALQRLLKRGRLATQHLREGLEARRSQTTHLAEACEAVGLVRGGPTDSVKVGDAWELLRGWYLQEGIAKVSPFNPDKLVWEEEERSDPWVKSSPQLSKALSNRLFNGLRSERVRNDGKHIFGLKKVAAADQGIPTSTTVRELQTLAKRLLAKEGPEELLRVLDWLREECV